jgi:hypothetical protein
MNRPRTCIPVSDERERWPSRRLRIARGDDAALVIEDEESLELKLRGERLHEN